MSKLVSQDSYYRLWVEELCTRFENARLRAATKVNAELLRFYWSVGEDLVKKEAESKWGDGIMKMMSQDLSERLPGTGGFSQTNLGYMKRFLIDKFMGNPKRAFYYTQLALANGWSRDTLLNAIDLDLHEPEGKAITNFKAALPGPQSDLAQQITKDPYTFDFVAVDQIYREKQLKDALVSNINQFLLELGAGFAYIGREYRLKVGETEQLLYCLRGQDNEIPACGYRSTRHICRSRKPFASWSSR